MRAPPTPRGVRDAESPPPVFEGGLLRFDVESRVCVTQHARAQTSLYECVGPRPKAGGGLFVRRVPREVGETCVPRAQT